MKRNIAFFISSNNKNNKSLAKAKNEFINLSKKFRYSYRELIFGVFTIGVIFDGIFVFTKNKECIEIPVGNLGNKPLDNDRFLNIKIYNNKVDIVNDYVGSIPVYYSKRNYFSMSSIEYFVTLDSASSKLDFSYENIYGFMKFMHFIWDETAYKHILTMLPDSFYSFSLFNLKVDTRYLQTVKSSDNLTQLTDKEIAEKLNILNDELIYESLGEYEQIILPLSSGYDSRMILVSLSKKTDLKEKLHCFTYGSIGSIEVEAGRRLTQELGVKWDFIDLPSQFLAKDYLHDIYDIFGSSLHMHGMYQLEFFSEISKKIVIKKNACLTSGFMTGVPAGQHNSLLGIENNKNLELKMNNFSQSINWSDDELNNIEVFKDKQYIKKASERFRMAFDRFEGTTYQRAVMFDVWTRQRNFIGYYPRTLEWEIPTISPHMNKKYANFFMSLTKKHLDNRLVIELMFKYHYPKIASIVSNSNGIKSINSIHENLMFFISRVCRKFKVSWILPKKYMNNEFDFDTPAIRHSKKDSIFPLLESNENVDSFISTIITKNEIKTLYKKAHYGNTKSYQQLIALQSIGLSILKMTDNNEH